MARPHARPTLVLESRAVHRLALRRPDLLELQQPVRTARGVGSTRLGQRRYAAARGNELPRRRRQQRFTDAAIEARGVPRPVLHQYRKLPGTKRDDARTGDLLPTGSRPARRRILPVSYTHLT